MDWKTRQAGKSLVLAQLCVPVRRDRGRVWLTGRSSTGLILHAADIGNGSGQCAKKEYWMTVPPITLGHHDQIDKDCHDALLLSDHGGTHGHDGCLAARPIEGVIEVRLQAGGFSNTSDYVRHLIRRDQERQQAIAAFQRAITEGIASGPGEPLDPGAFLADMRARHGRPGA